MHHVYTIQTAVISSNLFIYGIMQFYYDLTRFNYSNNKQSVKVTRNELMNEPDENFSFFPNITSYAKDISLSVWRS